MKDVIIKYRQDVSPQYGVYIKGELFLQEPYIDLIFFMKIIEKLGATVELIKNENETFPLKL